MAADKAPAKAQRGCYPSLSLVKNSSLRLRGERLIPFSALLFSIALSLCLHTGNGWCQKSIPSAAAPMSHLTGTFLIPQSWNDQSLLEGSHLGVVRIGLLPRVFADYAKAPAQFDWRRIDELIAANSQRTLMITLSSTYTRGKGEESPIPETKQELDTFIEFVSRIAQRHSNVIEYWQLDNEVTAPKNWPAERYADYARLLAAFHDAIRKTNPQAQIVVAGVPAGAIDGPRAGKLLQAIAQGAAGKVQAIDMHYHRSWTDGGAIAENIQALRRLLGAYKPLDKLDIVIAENSTWFEKPVGRYMQTESQQAVYAVESIYASLAEGARFCIFGTLVDRLGWKEQSEHRFGLNGLFYNPEKQYSAGKRGGGAKRVAFTMRLIAELTQDVTPEQISRSTSGPRDVTRIEVAGKRPYSVLWWSGSGATMDVQVPAPAGAKTARILSSVPDKDVQWPLKEPFEGFPSSVAPVQNGAVTVRLAPHSPVYVLPEK